MLTMEEGLTWSIPIDSDYKEAMDRKNISFLISDEVTASETDPDYEQFLADIWVGVVLTLMVLSCVCCMCSCLLYHKFQQWKRSVIEARNTANLESGTYEVDLPSYTIASGLPTYQEALEQLKIVKELTGNGQHKPPIAPSADTRTAPLSVVNFFQTYSSKGTIEEKPTD